MSDNITNEENEVLEKLNERKNQMKKWSNIIAGMTSSLAVAITVAMALGFFGQTKNLSKQELTEKLISIEKQFNDQSSYISDLKRELKNIESGLETVSKLPSGTEWKIEASKIYQDVQELKDKMNSLEDALTVNPAKALSIPILRKDLDNAEKSLRSELTQTRLEIERMYDQNKWFIGLMFTIALSVLGMAVSGFINRKDT